MKLSPLQLIYVVALLVASNNATAQTTSNTCSPIDSSTASETRTIVGEITINANDIFDLKLSGETKYIHRFGNRFHKQTRAEVIEQQLLFKSGDAFDLAKIVESERLLRQNDYLKSATITVVERCGNAIKISVTTRDHWSLIPKILYKRTGGESRAGIEVTEANLFGSGKELTFSFEQGVERDQTILEYRDKHVFGSRRQLTLQRQDNTDGERQLLEFKLPFYALDSTRAWRVAVDRSQLLSPLYTDRKITTIYDLDSRFADINFGFSKGLEANTLHRFWFGARFDETKLIDVSNGDAQVELPDRRFVYPYIAWQFQQPHFVKRSNLYMMEQVEDISLGHFFEARIGIASESFDSSVDALVLHTQYRKGWQGGNSLGLFSTKLDTFRIDSQYVNTIASPQMQWFWFQSSGRTLVLSAKAAIGDKLFAENQFLAGGDNGLRGYPLRMQSGSRRVLLSAEQRWYLNWYPWNLVRIGAAAFLDAGRAWNSDNADQADWLGNGGVGLRFLSTRHANALVVHVDVAIPFDQREDIDRVQLLLGSKAVF
ncbi:MAG: BamA/TamA family outer membrane protein [Granulosicoccaceae bacterium]